MNQVEFAIGDQLQMFPQQRRLKLPVYTDIKR